MPRPWIAAVEFHELHPSASVRAAWVKHCNIWSQAAFPVFLEQVALLNCMAEVATLHAVFLYGIKNRFISEVRLEER